MAGSVNDEQWAALARSAAPLFAPERLRVAREARGWSQRELVQNAEAAVTAAAISQYEGGTARPSVATLLRLSQALRFPPSFFAKTNDGELHDLVAYFRSLRSSSVRETRRARALAQVLWELIRTLEKYVRFPGVQIPRYPVDGEIDPRSLEEIAAQVRQDWGVPMGPIENLIETLEQHGIVTGRLPTVSDRVDAFSVNFPRRPVVVLGTASTVVDRDRFNGAHELGHLVMHATADAPTGIIEKQAHRFAAAFLMPADDILEELPSSLEWRRFLELKARWRVSLAALLYRARDLGRITQNEYLQAAKYMSARGWRRVEPGDLGASESPLLLTRAVHLVVAKGISLESLASLACLPLDDVRELIDACADPRPAVSL